MALGTRRTPERNSPLFSGLVIGKGVTVSNTLTTAGGVETMTTDELLTGLLTTDCQDAQTWTLPTAALLNAAIPGVETGSFFEFSIVNYGDSTLTIGLGTGITQTTIDSEVGVLTIATHVGARFRLECTGVAKASVPGSTDTWKLWTIGSGTCTA